MIDRWTSKVTQHVCLWGRAVRVYIGGEDYVPQAVNVMKLRGPQVVGVSLASRGVKDELRLSIVPVPAAESAGALDVVSATLTPDLDFGKS